MEKWRKRFEAPQDSLSQEQKSLVRHFHYQFPPPSTKSFSKFSNVDPILLKGNVATVAI